MTENWPEGAALDAWLGDPSKSTTAAAAAPYTDDIMKTVTRAATHRIYPETMPDGYDPDTLPEGTCPPDVRDALILDGARLLTRRHSADGVIANNELFIRISRADADVERLLHPYVYQPEA